MPVAARFDGEVSAGGRTIDAAGRVVAPGFIDVHTHVEGGIEKVPRADNYMLDGANNNDDVIGQRVGTQARTAMSAATAGVPSPSTTEPPAMTRSYGGVCAAKGGVAAIRAASTAAARGARSATCA